VQSDYAMINRFDSAEREGRLLMADECRKAAQANDRKEPSAESDVPKKGVAGPAVRNPTDAQSSSATSSEATGSACINLAIVKDMGEYVQVRATNSCGGAANVSLLRKNGPGGTFLVEACGSATIMTNNDVNINTSDYTLPAGAQNKRCVR
jgi:hypothetical protein